jgi:hypothetical protein
MKRTQPFKEEDTEILDTEEQESIVASIKSEALKQSAGTRNAFGIIFTVVMGIFIFCFIEFSINPWSMVHQMRFENEVSGNVFLGFYAVSALVFGVSAAISKYGRHRVPLFLWGPLLIATLLVTMTWLIVFWKLQIDVLLLYWIPFGDIAAMILALYVDRDMRTLIVDSENMENMKYDLKSA